MIFFDIDGTLIDHASASAAASLNFFDYFSGAIPFDRRRFPTIWEEIPNKHFNRFCRGEISLWEQRRARMREVFGDPDLSDDEADSRYQVFIRDYETRTRAFEDVEACLESLASSRLGIISNGAREQQIGKLKRTRILQYFSVLVFSEDVGLGKPSPAIFLEACRKAGDAPEECVHVGDSIEADIFPSRALGINGIHLCRPGNSLIAPPVISTLHNLPTLIN